MNLVLLQKEVMKVNLVVFSLASLTFMFPVDDG